MFYRKIQEKLYDYYENKESKILLVDGARQIGKSFIIRETASRTFDHYIEINLKEDFDNDKIYADIKSVQDFYMQINASYGNNIGDVNDTIIFLDEIQVYPHLITMLKALKQDNRYRYIASGSLLGITLRHIFIPMGSVEILKMYPMDFEEFLYAMGCGNEAVNYLRNSFNNLIPISDAIHKTMFRYFKEYLITGGLPDSIKAFADKENVYEVRNNQTITYDYYKDDAAQYDEEHNLKIRRIYDSLPSYMENKVKRIQYKKIELKEDTKYVNYQDEFDYLIHSGIALGVKAVSNPIFPLVESSSKNLIKLYYNDAGILSNILYKNNIHAIMSGTPQVNLGSLYETVCAQELIAHGHELYYFDSKKVGEVDFLINNYDLLSVMPIEIKSGKNQYNFRALPKLVNPEGNYKLKLGYVFGNDNIVKKEGNIIYMPIYLIMFV